jgi:diguanylate cyclase (GGDEF)-like protein
MAKQNLDTRGSDSEPTPARAFIERALLDAATPIDVADLLLDRAAHLCERGAVVVWSTRWPQNLGSHPRDALTNRNRHRLLEAVSAARAGKPVPADLRVLHDDGRGTVAAAVLPEHRNGLDAAELATIGARLVELADVQDLRSSVDRLEQAETLQRSLYAIADMAGSDLEMPDMLRGLHRIVSELMYAENFFIALYDRPGDSLRFVYFVDSLDLEGPANGDVVPMEELRGGISWYLVRDAKPMMGSPTQLQKSASGPLQMIGVDSTDCVGVPMLRDGQVRGIVVAQSYRPGQWYSSADLSLLAFMAEHFLTALERKQQQEELERRVDERTAQLANTNIELRREVVERERGERLQAALYRIASLVGSDESTERFYKQVHESVSELIDARNFYIALISDDGATVSFPYAVDEYEKDWSPRSAGLGLTEYVSRTGRAQLLDRHQAEQMMARGDLEPGNVGTPTLLWMGVPLSTPEGCIGVIAVQSYEDENCFDQRDAELLTFAAHQIASSLIRRRAAEMLQESNLALEQRVEERTAELRQQIAVREQVEAELQHRVMHDALTGLPNRVYLRDRLERAIGRAKRSPEFCFGLLYVDIDRFKVINDSLGHLAGDDVLREVSQRLCQCVREPDVVARLAGDEFAILLEDMPGADLARKIAQRVLLAMEHAVDAGDRSLRVSASVGAAIIDAHCTDADQVLHDADVALYRAKDAGRNRFMVFDEQMQRDMVGVLDMEQSLRNALINDEFVPYFQPLVRLDDPGQVHGYEALLRWQHPTLGLLAPGQFLVVAEDSGIIEAIDWRMFRLALECSRRMLTGNRFITLNVSPRLFRSNDFDGHLLALVRELDIDPARVTLEVTEGTLLRDPEAVVAMLHRLRGMGIQAALDDFGAGYSSLGHVHQFPLRMIKIDRSFVQSLDASGTSRGAAVVEAIIALADALNVEILAEGIETPAQHQALARLGCTFGQGYLFGRPAPALHWIDRDRA